MNCSARIEALAVAVGWKFTIDYRLRGGPNAREHWAEKARRVKAERAVTAIRFPRQLKGRGKYGSWTITLTRIAPGKCDDDNLSGMFKGVRDEIAKQLGLDDGSPRVAFVYAQQKGKEKEYAIEVCVNRVE